MHACVLTSKCLPERVLAEKHALAALVECVSALFEALALAAALA